MNDTKAGADAPGADAPARPRGGRVRIEDVAAHAGVSMKTVSRVLNNEPNVSARARGLVEAAVQALNYRPSPSARGLAGRRSYLVAMLFDNPSSNYLMEIEMGVLDACQAQHYNLMLAPLLYTDRDVVDKVEALVVQSQLDGVVLPPPITDDAALLARLEALGTPYSSVSAKEQHRHVGVAVDEHGAVCAMMAHLSSLGHRRIAGLQPIDSPAPDEGSNVNWLNIFYAVEWAIFAGFAFYMWYRLARDAWEKEVEALEEATAGAAPPGD